MSVVESIVGSVAGMALTALHNEARNALEFGRELDKLTTGLDNVKAYLKDTENLKSDKATHKRTLKLLRDLINEADDVITDCVIRYEYQREGSCSNCSCSELAFRYGTGKKLKDINAQMKDINDQLGGFLKPPVLNIQSDSGQQVIRYTSRDSIPSDEIVGLKSDVDKIKGWILSQDGDVRKIGIVGMGGLGKTTIAQKVVNDREVSSHFEKIIWVPVSQDFNEERIMRSMLEQLGKDELDSNEDQKLRRICSLLADNPYLIVIDDVWNLNCDNFEWWRTLSSSLTRSKGKSSCIVITTRNEDVALEMGVDASRIHCPKVLKPEESWLLFCKFAFSARKGICPDPQHEKVGKEILQKCGGLPLAIKTIAASLASKVQYLKDWEKARDDFHQLTASEQTGVVMASLRLSYDALPPHLKILLLCFSIYPEDTEIRAEQLVHWWVGEGLVRNKDDSKTSIELGFEYLSELAGRCLVEVMERRGYDGRIYSCKMHDLVRDLTIMIAEDESFCSFERGRQKLTEESRWLGIMKANGIDAKSLKSSLKVRALLVMPSREVFSLCKNVDPLHSLRVLDLSQSKLESVNMEDLLSWIFALKRLAFLNLSRAAGLKAVSSSIRKLRNLKILVLSGCSNLAVLDESVIKLKMLIILDLGSCGLPYLPRGIGQLSRLQELCGLKVVRKNNKRSCQLLELKKLTELRVLRISLSDESELSEDEYNIFSGLKKLKVLSINTEGGASRSFQQMLDRLTPPKDLQELHLGHYHYKILPKWVHPEKLSNLQYLCIDNADLGNIESESIWKIDGLCLKFLPNLELEWKDLQEKMPYLSYLEVTHCFNLKNFPCPATSQGSGGSMHHED